MADKPRGRPRKLPADTQLFTLRIPQPLHRELRHFCLDRGESMNDLILRVVGDWWDGQPERARYARVVKAAADGSEPASTRRKP